MKWNVWNDVKSTNAQKAKCYLLFINVMKKPRKALIIRNGHSGREIIKNKNDKNQLFYMKWYQWEKPSVGKVIIEKSHQICIFRIENVSSKMITLYRKGINDDIVLKKSHQRQSLRIERLSTMFFLHRKFINHDFVLKKSHHLWTLLIEKALNIISYHWRS